MSENESVGENNLNPEMELEMQIAESNEPESSLETAPADPLEQREDELPEAFKARLGRQEKRHKKELRELQAQLEAKYQHLERRMIPPSDEGEAVDDPKAQLEALMEEALEKIAVKRQRVATQAAYQNESEKLTTELEFYRDKHEDFEDVMQNFRGVNTAAIEEGAMLAPYDNGAEIIYQLAKNPAEIKRISLLPPIAQKREIAKMSGQLIAQQRKTSKAPAPLDSPKGSSVPTGNDKTSYSAIKQKTIDKYRRRYGQK
jgi:hypothetical protein